MRAACVHRCVHEILPPQTTRDTVVLAVESSPATIGQHLIALYGGNAHRLRLWPSRHAGAGDPAS
jgi:hypothetical protein